MIQILAATHVEATSDSVVELTRKPEFRRTTEAMRMAYVACERALASANLDEAQKENLTIVIGTAYGELEVTKDFLNDWFGSQLARPTLFQNSLHNAILGFLTIQLKLKGAGVTISNGERTVKDLTEMAQIFLQKEGDLCLVCHVDSYMQKLRILARYEGPPEPIGEGASVLLLSKSIEPKSSVQVPDGSFFSREIISGLTK